MKVALCGSAKFEDSFKSWDKVLSLQGHVVYTLSCYPSYAGGKNWYTLEEKKILDDVHKKKIDNSDAIFVVNTEERYIGDSTKSEISYALSKKKVVYWEFWPLDEDIDLWFPHGNGVFTSPLFKGACNRVICPNFLGNPPCCVCYE